MKVCKICDAPYRSPYQHVKDKHRKYMWEQFDHEHPMRPGYCHICKKPIQESMRKHAIKKHLGKAAREYVNAGMLYFFFFFFLIRY